MDKKEGYADLRNFLFIAQHYESAAKASLLRSSDASLAIRNKSDPSLERRETPYLGTDFSQSTPFMCRTWNLLIGKDLKLLNLLIGKDLNHSKGWARTQIYSCFVCRSSWFTVSNALLRSNFDNPYAVYIKTPLLGKNRKGGNCYVKRSKAELTWI